ncbi:hypothetical protein GQ53DRAFT_189515 [Thozetella sp. PMI_491]|nr:hypothetical protein GQ53DRAFT_189515 [Thozetella sp. PMI_491]
MTIETLRSSIQAETRIEPASQHLYLNGRLITDNSKTMAELEIGDGELLALHVRDMRGSTGVPAPTVPNRQAQQQRAEGPRAAEQDAEVIRLQLLGDPRLRAEVSRQQPELASALEDPQRFAQVYAQSLENDRRARAERQRQIQLLNADPFDPEAQAKIAEIIRQERVMENLQNAMEHNPEGRQLPRAFRDTLPGSSALTASQSSAACTCSTSTLKSTATRSRPWWTRAPRPPS